jgi:putative heme transporter
MLPGVIRVDRSARRVSQSVGAARPVAARFEMAHMTERRWDLTRRKVDGVDGSAPVPAVEPPLERPIERSAPARMPQWLDTGAGFAWRFLLLAAALYVVVLVLDRLLVVVVPIVIAAMLTTVLAPPAQWLRRRGWPPALATWAVFLAAFLVVGALLAWLIPAVGNQVNSLQHSADNGVDQVKHWLTTGPLQLSKSRVNRDFTQLGNDISANAGGIALQGATIVLELVVGLLLSLVTTFFFVKDGERLAQSALRLADGRRVEELSELGRRGWATLSGYVRGTTVNGLVNGTLMGAGLLILGVPLALPLAVLTFFGAYFPIVGAVATGALAALIALAAQGPVTALVVIGITVLIHNLEGYLVGPFVLGRAVHLHPLGVLLALAAGGVIAGIVGAFLAVPVTAVAVTTLQYYRQAGSTSPDESGAIASA